MKEFFARDDLCLQDLQAFHKSLDCEKGFDLDKLRNVAVSVHPSLRGRGRGRVVRRWPVKPCALTPFLASQSHPHPNPLPARGLNGYSARASW
jgi:hypothetical protein